MKSLDTTAQRRLRVMMITEGTYPYHWGGVSTWCHLLLNDLPNVDFTLISLVSDPVAKLQFKLPASVVEFRSIPMWGVREILETRPALRGTDLWMRKWRTADRTVEYEFIPVFWAFLKELFADQGNPYHLATLVHSMHRFFLDYDFDKAMRSQLVWDCFVDVAQTRFPPSAAEHGYAGERFTLTDLSTCFHWLYHWLFPLAAPLPKVDVVHAAMAGVCTLVATAVKLEHGAAFMLTEHGIYLRERYLAEAATSASLFCKLFSLGFARRMTELSYALADQIAPCCDFNQRWELRNGATPGQLKTIYYGVDSVVFTPEAKPAGEPPVVVWVGRIDPLKDLFTLIRSAAVVHAARPEIEFRLFGSAPPGNEAYYEKCLELRRDLGLEQTVTFAGFRSNPAGAFNQGDVVVLSSVSEAFPFVILEAMLCEKPVVATAVGGVPEQIKGCGIVVEPRNYQAMAEAILTLINDPELSRALGVAARKKAEQEYSVRQSAQAHEAAYRMMTNRKAKIVPLRVQLSGQNGRPSIPFLRVRGVSNGNHLAVASGASSALVRSARTADIASMAPALSGSGFGYPQQLPAEPTRFEAQPVANHVPQDATDKSIASVTASARNCITEWCVPQMGAILMLAVEVAQQDVQPIDGLEVTAVLESIGITDDVAIQRYGAPDVFALGEAVFTTIIEEGLASRLADSLPVARVSRKEAWMDYLKGPLGLVPPILLLLTIAAFSHSGEWTAKQVMLLSAGMTASMMLTNGLVQGISRRTSIYLGAARPRMAARYLQVSTATVTAITLGLILLAAFLLGQFGLFTDGDLRFFLLSFVGLTVVWMAAGGLSLLQQPFWLSIALAAGLLCAIAVNAALSPDTQFHLVISATFGYVSTLSVVFLALHRGFSKLEARPSSSKARTELPSLAYMIDEAAPYFSYGFVYMILIFLPHIFGWIGQLPDGQTRSSAVTNIEIGLTFSMPPLILAYGVAEYSLRVFWRSVATFQSTTPATDVGLFGMMLVSFTSKRRWTYLVILTIFTILAHFVFRSALTEGWLGRWLQPTHPAQLLYIFDVGLVAYWLLGLGLYNCMFAVTLGRPQVAFCAVLCGGFVMVVTGAMLCQISFTLAAVAFALAAFVFAAISWRETNQVLRSADYSFASVLP